MVSSRLSSTSLHKQQIINHKKNCINFKLSKLSIYHPFFATLEFLFTAVFSFTVMFTTTKLQTTVVEWQIEEVKLLVAEVVQLFVDVETEVVLSRKQR
jgi:hypothetical protein